MIVASEVDEPFRDKSEIFWVPNARQESTRLFITYMVPITIVVVWYCWRTLLDFPQQRVIKTVHIRRIE